MPEPEDRLASMNRVLAEAGLPELLVVRPSDCTPQDVNARYMAQGAFDNLVENIRRDQRLESVPLVCRDDQGRLLIVSGHHRIKAAQRAGIERIIVMVTDGSSSERVRAKQLSHNAICGRDDEVVLSKMYESISDLAERYYSGLQDQLAAIATVSLNVKTGTFREFVIAFLPEEIQSFDHACEAVQDLTVRSGSTVRITELAAWPLFADAIRRVKKAENIKSNAASLSRLVELALQKLAELEASSGANGP